MKYFDPDVGGWLKSELEEIVLPWSDVTATTMFGCPSYQAGGTLFAVLVSDGVALTRLPPEHRERIDQEFETGPFQAGNRTVKKWAYVTINDVSTLNALTPYLRMSYTTALGE